MGWVLDRFGPARVVAVGFACLTAGYTWFLRIAPVPAEHDEAELEAVGRRR